jgi:hypothetical protein
MRRARREDEAGRDAEWAEPAPAPPRLDLLALQRSAGNHAVARLVGSLGAAPRSIARYTQGQVSDRAFGIWEEKGAPGSQSSVEQGADWAEGEAQVGAQERETRHRAEDIHAAKGVIGPQTAGQAQADWLQAEASIAAQFTCDRIAEWGALLTDTSLWDDTGLSAPEASALTTVHDKLTAVAALQLQDATMLRRDAIADAEAAVDNFAGSFAASQARLSDQLMMLKMHTLGHERRKLLIAERIEQRYGIGLDSFRLVAANQASYDPKGKKTEDDFMDMMLPEVFSLEELQAMETVLERYAKLLGPQRVKELGAQPMTTFGRANFGIDYDDKGAPERDPDTRGESFSAFATIGMYDAGSAASQFPTGMQQFRGTLAHELSHALLENLEAAKGQTMIQKYVADSEMWTSVRVTPYRRKTNQLTAKAVTDDGKEAPITAYGCTNAQEDMADAIKYLFEDAAKLQAGCPKRYKWLRENLDAHFDDTWVKSLPAVAGAPVGVGGP